MTYRPNLRGKDDTSIAGSSDISSEYSAEKCLIFRLSRQEYAMGVSMVKEVIHYTGLTAVPNTCSYVKGVLPLRGIVIPVLDFMEYIGRSATNVTGSTRILIVHYDDFFIGILADSVEGIVSVPLGRYLPVPDFIGKESLKYFKAAFKFNNNLILLIETRMEHI